jgi:hypothetical protein
MMKGSVILATAYILTFARQFTFPVDRVRRHPEQRIEPVDGTDDLAIV